MLAGAWAFFVARRSSQLWSLASGECEHTFTGGHGDGVAIVALAYDDRRICSADERGGVRVWSFGWKRLAMPLAGPSAPGPEPATHPAAAPRPSQRAQKRRR